MSSRADSATPELLARLRAGDRHALEGLLRAWYPRLAEYAASILGNRDAAEDAVQEAFIAVWNRRDSLPDDARFLAYVHRAVRNRALNQIRRHRTAARWLSRAAPELEAPPVAQEALEQAELNAALRAALADLAPRTREVFLLSRDRGLTYLQIADTLGISVKTVETLMGRALKALRARLEDRLRGEA
jgi:RNA polymerase sigma-70 factor, ECF subfamily